MAWGEPPSTSIRSPDGKRRQPAWAWPLAFSNLKMLPCCSRRRSLGTPLTTPWSKASRAGDWPERPWRRNQRLAL
ncbi:MAG: hypothetical protein EBU30_11335 [Synechococcaceae bacterium WB6_3B_236]|nr:hypothetical protein [Synechococcaceae bacterium WB6_3B_236]